VEGAVQLKEKVTLPELIAVGLLCVISPTESLLLVPAASDPPVALTSRPACVREELVLATMKEIDTVSPGSTVLDDAEKVEVVVLSEVDE
jgi:hypothetical protein